MSKISKFFTILANTCPTYQHLVFIVDFFYEFSSHTCFKIYYIKRVSQSLHSTHFPILVMQIYEANFQFCDFISPIQHEKGGVSRNTLQSVFEHYTKISISCSKEYVVVEFSIQIYIQSLKVSFAKTFLLPSILAL